MQDVIELVESSEWISPIVVTTRKDRPELRVCVDLREPNKSVVVDGFPLPHMEEMFTELRGATLFSTLDRHSAYHQMPLYEDSHSLTTFITHDGLFHFKQVPFGLVSAPSCFQQVRSTILKGGPVLPRWHHCFRCNSWGAWQKTDSCASSYTRCWAETESLKMQLQTNRTVFLGAHSVR